MQIHLLSLSIRVFDHPLDLNLLSRSCWLNVGLVRTLADYVLVWPKLCAVLLHSQECVLVHVACFREALPQEQSYFPNFPECPSLPLAFPLS